MRKMIDKMKTLKKFVNENVDGGLEKIHQNIPDELYHYTSELNFDKIMDTNQLKPSEKYGNRLSVTSDVNYHKNEHGLNYGNTKLRITLDNNKLKNDGYVFTVANFIEKP